MRCFLRRIYVSLVPFSSLPRCSPFVWSSSHGGRHQRIIQLTGQLDDAIQETAKSIQKIASVAASPDEASLQQKPMVTVEEINKVLVHQGLFFDSFRRRFDFGGTWIRNSMRNDNVEQLLMAVSREDGSIMSPEDAAVEANRPYSQKFVRERVTSEGVVFTINVDDGRRIVTYELGDWKEDLSNQTTVGAVMRNPSMLSSSVERRTYWAGDSHVTTTRWSNSLTATTKRYLDEHGHLVVERSLTSDETDQAVQSREYFEPVYADWGPLSGAHVFSSRLQQVAGCIANVRVRTTLLPKKRDVDPSQDLSQLSYNVQVDGEADALVSRGLLSLVSGVFARTSSIEECLSLRAELLASRLGVQDALSRGRNDGLASIVRVVQQQIKELLLGDEPLPETRPTTERESKRPTVAMLLSGGVDSSVALKLLKQQGYEITAFYLKIWLEDELAHLGQCPWEDDYRMCEEVCRQVGVPLEAVSLQQQYKERIISYTVREAQLGRTPNPDIMCNSRVKFGCFYDSIEGRGFDYVASGHYAQLVRDDKTGLKKLVRAPDPVKDQSYFLSTLSQQQLQRVLFPIGQFQKSEVRQMAHDFDLPNKARRDSQGLCFLGKVKFDEFLSAYLGEEPGDIIDAATGESLGRHNGIWYHTVGQRRGIGKVLDPIATSRGPWYVVAKDPPNRIVYASNEYEQESFTQARSDVRVEDVRWIRGLPPEALQRNRTTRFHMKIRHGPKLVEGSLTMLSETTGNVKLDKKDNGLAPGQYVVFYERNGDECYGAGVIGEHHWGQLLHTKRQPSISLPASAPEFA